jgi:hypothetical protein
MTDVVGAFLRGEAVEGLTDDIGKSIDGTGLGLQEKFCEFGKGHLDRIEITAVARQDQEACASAGDEQPQQSLSKESSA